MNKIILVLLILVGCVGFVSSGSSGTISYTNISCYYQELSASNFSASTGNFTNLMVQGVPVLTNVGENVFYLNRTTRSVGARSVPFVSISSTNFPVSIIYPDCLLSWGKLYSLSTNTFSKTLTLTFYANNDYSGSNAYWRANMLLVTVPLISTSTNVAIVVDTTGFGANDLVYFTESNEFARISSVVGNNLIFENNLVNPHSATCAVSRVAEFGGFATIDLSGTSNLWTRISSTNSFTQTLNLDYIYRR